MISKHFSRAELACRGTGELKLAEGFIEALEALRETYGYPMVVTSCCRTVEHNQKVGGHPASLHLIGNPKWGVDTCAIDIARPSGDRLHRLISFALRQGWSVGLAKTFVHLDRRSFYLQLPPVFYTY